MVPISNVQIGYRKPLKGYNYIQIVASSCALPQTYQRMCFIKTARVTFYFTSGMWWQSNFDIAMTMNYTATQCCNEKTNYSQMMLHNFHFKLAKNKNLNFNQQLTLQMHIKETLYFSNNYRWVRILSGSNIRIINNPNTQYMVWIFERVTQNSIHLIAFIQPCMAKNKKHCTKIAHVWILHYYFCILLLLSAWTYSIVTAYCISDVQPGVKKRGV